MNVRNRKKVWDGTNYALLLTKARNRESATRGPRAASNDSQAPDIDWKFYIHKSRNEKIMILTRVSYFNTKQHIISFSTLNWGKLTTVTMLNRRYICGSTTSALGQFMSKLWTLGLTL